MTANDGQDTDLTETLDLAARNRALQAELDRLRKEIDGLRLENQELAARARFPDENPNPVLRLDRGGRVLYANAASEALLDRWGCRVGELAPESWRRAAAQALATGERPAVDAEANGRTVSLIVAPVPGAGYVNLFGRDVTEQRQVEQTLGRSERLFRTLFDVLPIGVSILDEQGHVLAANEALGSVLQLPVEGVVRGDYARRSYVRADGSPMPGEEFPTARAFREQRAIHNAEVGIVKEDGETIWTSVSASPVPLPDAAVVVATADITARKRAEDAAAAATVAAERLAEENFRERAFLEQTLDTMTDAVLIYGPEAQIIRANGAARRMLRLDDAYRQMPVGERVSARRVLWPDGRPVTRDETLPVRALAGETVRNEVMVMFPPPDGDAIWFSASAAPLRGPGGEVTGAVASLTDVTALHEAQAKLQQANVELAVRKEELEVQAEELQAQNAELAAVTSELEVQRAQFEAIVEQMPAGVLIAEAPSGRVVMMNRQAEELLRGPYRLPAGPDDYMQFESFYPDGRPYHSADMPLARTIVAGEKVRDEEIHFRRGDGSRGVQIASSSPVVDRQGRITAGVLVFYDVTERNAMEDALRQAEERYRAFVEYSTEGIWRIELEQPIPVEVPHKEQVHRLYQHGYLAECNETLARMHGFASAEEAVGTRLGQLVPILSAANMHHLRSFVNAGYRLGDVELTEIGHDGQVRHFANSLLGIVDTGQNALTRVWGIKRDITERVRIEEELRRAREELETLLTIAGRVAAVLDLPSLLDEAAGLLGEVVDFTGLALYRLGEKGQATLAAYRGPASAGESAQETAPPIGIDAVAQALAEGRPVIVADAIDDSEPARAWRAAMPAEVRQRTGPARSWLIVPLTVQERLIGVLRLTHEEPGRFGRHEADLALAFAHHVAIAMENARLYEEAKEAAAARERQRLAHDLHDAVSQVLFSASLLADVLPLHYARDPEQGKVLLAELRDLQHGAMAEMRALLLELRPAALLQTDLGTLLRQLSQAITGRTRIQIEVQSGAACVLPGEVQVALYRIAQEALNNVGKHSNASTATVTLDCDCGPRLNGMAECVEITIADDGRGFDPQAIPQGRLGLGIMAERAREIGAAVRVASTEGHGTRVTVNWPAVGTE